MARPKKIIEETKEEVIPTPIVELSIDYPSEGLNNMARKINELVARENARILGK